MIRFQIIITSLIVLSLLIMASCTKDVNIILPEHSPSLVVNSYFNPDSLWEISVTHDRQTLSDSTIQNVENATVELFENGTLVETLSYFPPEGISWGDDFYERRGFYKSLTHRPSLGAEYTLKVAADDYDSVESTDVVPASTVEIQSFSYEGINAEGAASFEVKMRDMGEGLDYYHLLLRVKQDYWYLYDGDTIWGASPEHWKYFYISSTADDVLETETDGLESVAASYGYLYSDELFNGNTKTINLGVWSLADELSVGNPEYGTRFELKAVVRTVSEAYYRYQKSLALQYTYSDDPFSEPVFIFNNIEGGFGNFSGYSSVVSETLVVE